MIAISIEHVESVISGMKTEIEQWKLERLIKLEELHQKKGLNLDERSYILLMMADWDKLIYGKPDYLDTQLNTFPLPNAGNNDRRKQFKDKVINAAGYNDLRSKFYPEYFRRIGIKACAYCNSQLAVSVDGYRFVKGRPVPSKNAKFQVDHYIDKSKYPCFSVSLYNLYPICASCNNSKSANKIYFPLYVQEKDKLKRSGYRFVIKPKTLAQYIKDRKAENLDFDFTEPPYTAGVRNFKETFDIEGIYRTQRDIMEELILKKEIYTEAYVKQLRESFEKIMKDANLFDRLILGNYVNESEIHNRPLAKFTQDIAESIGFVFKKD